ncbi:MAG: cytochrome P450 [Sphingomonadaceae bacterium]|uniref:cytochrome P450 n=1 Tax=Thermaurantiacus sp. TaxID=2820283 RepID=UPI00298F3D01|nr:cytochrome P450 [Thermaurantiacus sp.]MCS6987724.1 cytochrome P450 [Sphingomonadaceae bacterium]MDW8415056.1 cytochrome P450 [Thermaurantiacus sp.]
MQAPPGFFDLLRIAPDDATGQGPFARLMAECPVLFDPPTGHLLVASHGLARRILADGSLRRHPANAAPGTLFARFTDRRPADPALPPSERSSILLLDAPDHLRIRAPLQRAFHARVARSAPLVAQVVDQALSRLRGRRRFDVVAELAIPIPIHAIARILGVGHDQLERFRELSEDLILVLNPLRSDAEDARAQAATDALHAVFRDLLVARRRQPADDLVSDLVRLQADGVPLSDAELVLNLTALLVGGNLTTTDLLASAVRLVLSHPDEQAQLAADPSRVEGAIEETLRLEGPVDFTPRVTPGPLVVEGVAVPAGTPIFAILRAANRDPAAFPDPDRFDIDRPSTPHLAFGGGAHYCIGAPLARLEGRLFLARFLGTFPSARLPEQRLAYRWLPGFRGLQELWVET